MKQEEYILLDLDPNTEHCAEAPRHKTGEKDRFTEPISSAAAETPAKAAKKAKTIYKVRLKMIRWPRKNSSKGETVVKKQSAAVQKTSLDNLIDDPSWFMIDNPSPGSASEIESSGMECNTFAVCEHYTENRSLVCYFCEYLQMEAAQRLIRLTPVSTRGSRTRFGS